MNIRSLPPLTLSGMARISQHLSTRSHLLAARPALPDLHRKYHGAPIGQHQTTEFLKRLVDAKESKELSFGEIAKRIGRGAGLQIPPTDPLMYRLYEFLIVYGFPLKSIIHEKFGDGIMSAIDFTCEVKKVEQDKAESMNS
ncbi:cyanate lyase [Puccinia graminis f. sp. tritici CRL 75-36-700-3]|uniref:Cyanate lyase n=1 Tax=Puccinia graminis f. sp. tritici (strain CRL 75-36-700-3 / race SCCL) TaxID=418459 RepID=E3L0E0_PUCGT|nr:cyanate lyase [Puccinia graminis f. sp. tritici CRL 75-36-700-3]EFP90038.1 cyanate lyase [Puccinia graminis f. sp. tritici CRL 75-36-700-3]